MSNSLHPDHNQHYVGPDLGLNYLQRLSAMWPIARKELNSCLPFTVTFYLLQVRLYSIAIEDSQIIEHIGYSTLEIPILKSYGNVHFRMEESLGATTLTNSGSLSATANLSGARFVTVSIYFKCFKQFYLIETPFNNFANRADLDQAALVRAA